MNLIQRAGFKIGLGIAKIVGIENKFHEAFFKYLGGQYTQYDTNGKTYIEEGYNKNPDVYSIIRQKATKHSSIPYGTKIVKDQNAKKQSETLRLSVKTTESPEIFMRYKSLCKKAFEEKELDFPMERPNPIQTWTQFFDLYSTFMDLNGNFYMWMMRPSEGPNAGKPIAVYVLPSHLMKIVLKPEVDMMDGDSPIHSYMLIEGQVYTEFLEEDVIHVSDTNPNYDMQGSHLYGVSRLKAGLRNIQSSNTTIDNNIKAMSSGGAFGFIHGKGQTPMTPDQAAQIKSRLKEMDADSSRMAKYAGVSAEIGFTRISLTTDELRPFDFLKFDQKMICNVLRWEDKLLNNEVSSSSLGGRSEYELAEKRALTKAVIPDNTLLENALNDKFIPLFPGYENAVFAFHYDDLPEMQPDMKILTTWLNNALDRGVITRNEYRNAIRFVESTDPGMDSFTVSTDIFTLEEAIAEPLKID